MLSIDRANVHMEAVPGSAAPAAGPPAAEAPAARAPAASMSDDEFRARVLRVLEEVLREIDRRGSR